ncbi:hypothetical protein [Pedobacter sp. FW305-3-2-15-E-R2A2]|jgi:hypothetical protein|uniref:hypothetical protein n=1 Tax=Pedobacter sp. FW305-3-2-15-E-R2A2 TaxID=3140251 RepID=UPI0031409279
MSLDKYISSILEQIRGTENYQQVDDVLVTSVDHFPDQQYVVSDYLSGLEKRIEGLSPFELNSTQFSCFRYALICLRGLSKKVSIH